MVKMAIAETVYDSFMKTHQERSAQHRELYNSELKTPCHLAINKQCGKNFVWVVPRFDCGGLGAVDAYFSYDRKDICKEALSKYSGNQHSFAIGVDPRYSDPRFGVRVFEGTATDSITAKLPPRMNRNDANILTEMLDALKIGYKYENGELWVDETRPHKKMTVDEMEAAFGVLSRSSEYASVSSDGPSSHMYADKKRISVHKNFTPSTSEDEKRRGISELQSLTAQEVSWNIEDNVSFWGINPLEPILASECGWSGRYNIIHPNFWEREAPDGRKNHTAVE